MGQLSKRVCLITGGSGFIGTHLLDYLLKRDAYDRILVLDLKPPQVSDERVQYFECDIRQPISVDCPAPVSVCIHLAALCKEPGYEWEAYFRTNYVGTANVCELVRSLRIRNLVYTSTMMVYDAGEQAMCEESITAPSTAYGLSKLLGEEVLRRWAAGNPGLRLRIVRPAVVFGKGEGGNFTRLYRALKRGTFCYIGRRSTVKSWIYVKDLVAFIAFLIGDTRGLSIYNACYPAVSSIGNICNTMCEVFSFRRPRVVVPYRAALMAGYLGEFLSGLGWVRSALHHRRVQKLYNSTHILSERMLGAGFRPAWPLEAALQDWSRECSPDDPS